MLLRRPILSADLALLVSASAALSIPSPLNTYLPSDPINITESSLKAPLGHLQNLTYTPWPTQPYQIPIYPRFGFPDLNILRAREFHGTRSVSVPRLQDFIREFRDNLEREYPIPGFVPRTARQSNIDIQSYTMWTIETIEGVFGNRLPTAIALVALDEIARQLGKHGPATLFFSINERISMYSYGFLEITEFGDVSLNRSLANGNNTIQTS